MSDFVPLSQRSDLAAAEVYRTTLHEGMPDWLRHTLLEWCDLVMSKPCAPSRYQVLEIAEALLRLRLDWSADADSAWAELKRQMIEDHRLALEVVDYVLRAKADAADEELLSLRLRAAGSAWTVRSAEDDGFASLVRRVDETTARGAKRAMAEPTLIAHHLREAWSSVYGRSPSPGLGYDHAVRAIEAAARPIVAPDDGVAALAQMVSAMRDEPERWTLAIDAEGDRSSIHTVIALMRTVLTRQHRSDGSEAGVTIQSAETALHAALTLVHWFSAGLVRRTADDGSRS